MNDGARSAPRTSALVWIELDRAAVAHDLAEVRRLAGGRPVLAVVKGDAYGHGAATLCPELQRLGVEWFGVARVREAAELRGAGIDANILNMGFFAPGEEEVLVAQGIVQALFRIDDAERLSREALRRRSRARVHLKVDTGMGRLGVRHDDAVEFARRVAALDGLAVEGAFSVLAEEPEFDLEQARRLQAVVEALPFPHLVRHLASSAALVQEDNGPLLLDMVRSGIMLHGLYPSRAAREERRADLRPVLCLKTRIGLVKTLRRGESAGYHRAFTAARDTRVALLPIGFSDGVDLGTGGGSLLIRGRRFPFVTAATVDLGGAADVAEGDEVVLIGRQGAEEIPADEVAERTGQSVYAVMMRLAPHIARMLV